MKNTSLLIRTGIIIAITLIAVYLVLGPRRAPNAQDFTWEGMKQNLTENINLGLDLKGGSHLLLQIKVEDYLKKVTENNGEAAHAAAVEAKLPVGEVKEITDAQGKNYQIVLATPDAGQQEAIVEAIKKKVDLSQWTETRGADNITWTLPGTQQKLMSEQAFEQVNKIVEGRINKFGVTEPTIARAGKQESYQLLLQMPGVDDPERVKKLLAAESRLELMKVVGNSNPMPITTYPTKEAALQSLGGSPPSNRRVMPYMEREDKPKDQQNPTEKKEPTSYVVVEYPAVVDGSELREAAAVSRTGNDNDYQIAFSFKPAGAQKFGAWTGANVNAYMAVVLNDEVKSAPYIRSQIFDSGEISGRFTKTSAEDLALTLKSGALPAKIDYEEERTVGPSLGADSINSGVRASVGGLVFVIIFMLFYYRGSGINAVIALLLNMLLTLAALIMVDSTLTLPGIAGLILGIGMAVDSNVLIFERIREELRAGHSVPESVRMGFDRAFITIIDTHITTILSSVILYMSGGSGLIRGFAVTLILGLLINLFTAVFVSKTIFLWLLGRKQEQQKLSI
jgi:preprotein translocase subunit SecD